MMLGIAMIIDHDKKVIGVCVAKTGSTTLRRVFRHTKDPKPEIYHMFLRDILSLDEHYQSYYKFGFVRNPYERIHSIYCDFKWPPANHSWAKSLKRTKSFEDFVLNLEKRKYKNYIHLQPQTDYLFVNGLLGVDFLGRYENYSQDVNKLLAKFNIQVSKELPKIRASIKKEPLFYTDEMKEVVRRVYKQDFENFNYEK